MTAEWITGGGNRPTLEEIEAWRGDDASEPIMFTLPDGWVVAQVLEAKFQVRRPSDNALAVALALTTEASQWTIATGADACEVTLVASDTDGLEVDGNSEQWYYDIQLHYDSDNDGSVDTIRTIKSGPFILNKDWANDSGGGALSGLLDEQLVEWGVNIFGLLSSITYHGTYVYAPASGTITWPDGSAGTYTTTSYDATHEDVEAWTATHDDSGKTVTQAAVTRDANGQITTRPALTVA